MMTSPMTAAEAERLAKMEGLVLVPSNSGPHHPRYLGVSMHTDPATNEVFFCASVIQGGTTLYLQDAHGNVKFTSDAEAALTFARYTAGRLGMDERPQAPVMTKAEAERLARAEEEGNGAAGYKHVVSLQVGGTVEHEQEQQAVEKPYQMQVNQNGVNVAYGQYGSAPEAALAYARQMGAHRQMSAPGQMGAPGMPGAGGLPAGQHHCSAAYALASLPAPTAYSFESQQSSSKPKPAKPKEPKEVRAKQPKAPPLSAYLCFAHATRLKLVEEAKAQARADGDGPGQGGSSFSSAIERQLGKAWKELGAEEKKHWESVASENRDRYTEECRVAGAGRSVQRLPRWPLLGRCGAPWRRLSVATTV
eukprot:Transcript_13514.p1 GENE.Transcript_13514~~Transcript_13514.p1  ORF type:complete len:363 (+),score=74.31 Transcript_13514:144-1232(+)